MELKMFKKDNLIKNEKYYIYIYNTKCMHNKFHKERQWELCEVPALSLTIKPYLQNCETV